MKTIAVTNFKGGVGKTIYSEVTVGAVLSLIDPNMVVTLRREFETEKDIVVCGNAELLLEHMPESVMSKPCTFIEIPSEGAHRGELVVHF